MVETRQVTYKVVVETAEGKRELSSFKTTMQSMNQDSEKSQKSMQGLADQFAKVGQTAKVTVDESKEFSQNLKAQHRESVRTEKAMAALVGEYTHLESRLGKSSDEQEILNAQFRLGKNATKAQRDEVERLIRAYQTQRKAADQTQGSMRGLKGQMQNLGWQFQDVAVQAQMGTDALVIIGQQGSQLASGFGATGALIGAGIAGAAVGFGVLSKAMGDTKGLTKELNKDIEELVESIKALNDNGKTSQLDKVIGADLALLKMRELNTQVASTAIKLSKAKEEAERFSIALDGKQIEKSAELLERDRAAAALLQKQYDNLAKELSYYQQIREGATAEGISATQATKDLIKEIELELSLMGESADEIERYKLAKAGANLYSLVELQRLQELRASKQKEIDLTKEATEAQKEYNETMFDIGQSQLDNTDLISFMQTKEDLLNTQFALDISRVEKAKELGIASEEDAQRKITEIAEAYTKKRASIDGRYLKEKAEKQKDNNDILDKFMFESIDRFNAGFGDAMANAIFESDSLGEAMAGLFKDTAKNMVSFFAEWASQKMMIWALDRTIGAATQASSVGATTGNAMAGVQMAGINAYQSAAAIPITGWTMAPTAAASAIAATGTMASAAIASAVSAIGAYDKGGRIPAGGAGIVSEFGDELVGGTMVYNGSPNSLAVTGREETARRSGGSVNVGGITINSSGEASPSAIARALTRALKKANKSTDTAIYDSMNRGKNNRGKRFA